MLRTETTPAKAKRSKSLDGPLSPQPAACAPSGAAMPLPSSTTASPRPSREASAPKLTTPTSIKRWLTPSPARPPPRQVLSPYPQSTTSSTSPTERRAKRRLETGDGSPSAISEECDGVMELDPATKRTRALSEICCSAEDDERSSGSNGGKENLSPGRRDWLSVMSQKKRKIQGSSRIHKSPVAAKKPDGKIPASPVSTEST